MKKIIQLLCICLLTGCHQTTVQKHNYVQEKSLSEKRVQNTFENSVFIGGLRLLGLQKISHFEQATFYALQNVSIDMIANRRCVTVSGERLTIMEMLQEKNYQKVYLDLGDYEIEWMSAQMFVEKYSQLIETLKETLPQADIYIQGLLPNVYKNISKEKINCYNIILKQLCQKKQVIYLDIKSILNEESPYAKKSDKSYQTYFHQDVYKRWAAYLENYMRE